VDTFVATVAPDGEPWRHSKWDFINNNLLINSLPYWNTVPRIQLRGEDRQQFIVNNSTFPIVKFVGTPWGGGSFTLERNPLGGVSQGTIGRWLLPKANTAGIFADKSKVFTQAVIVRTDALEASTNTKFLGGLRWDQIPPKTNLPVIYFSLIYGAVNYKLGFSVSNAQGATPRDHHVTISGTTLNTWYAMMLTCDYLVGFTFRAIPIGKTVATVDFSVAHHLTTAATRDIRNDATHSVLFGYDNVKDPNYWPGEVGQYLVCSGAWTLDQFYQWAADPYGWVDPMGGLRTVYIPPPFVEIIIPTACPEATVELEATTLVALGLDPSVSAICAMDANVDADIDLSAAVDVEITSEPTVSVEIEVCTKD